MAFEAGSAYVSILPDFRKFQTNVKAELDELDEQFAKAGDKQGKVFADAFTARLRTSLANVPDVTIKVDADTTAADTELNAEAAKARTATVTAKADTTAADADLDADVAKVRQPTFTPKADTTSADTALDASADKVRTPAFTPKADTAKVDAELDAAAKPRTATVDVDTKTTESKISELEQKLEALTKKRTAEIDVTEVLQKGGTLSDLANPAAIGAALGVALEPQITATALGLGGIGTAFVAAGADAGAFGVVAKGMFTDVTTAQKNLATAQADYAKADTSAARIKALQDEKTALAGLTPAEQQLAVQLTALTSGWKAEQQALQPVVGAALTPWLQTATSGMSLLNPLVQDGAGAIQLLGTEAQTAFQSPFWSLFAGDLGTTGQLALISFGQAAGSVGDGLAHLFTTFAPDIDQLLPLVDQLAKGFDTWAKSVTSGGLEDFFTKTFSPANVAALAKDGSELATFVENVAKSSQEMSPLAFTGLGNVLTIMGNLTPTEIEALTGLFLAVKTIGTISKGVSAVSSVVSQAKSLLGLGSGTASTAASTAQGAETGTLAGKSAATAFTSTFSDQLSTSLPTAFTAIATKVATAADGAGTVWGSAASKTFGTAFGDSGASAVTAAFATVSTAGEPEATAAGTAWGTTSAKAYGTGFSASDEAGVTTALATVATAGEPEATAAGTEMGESAGKSFALSFGESARAALPAAFTTVDAEGVIEGKVLGTETGDAATTAFAASYHPAEPKVIPGEIVKDGDEKTEKTKGKTSPKEEVPKEKTPAKEPKERTGTGTGVAGVIGAVTAIPAIEQAIPKGPGGEWVNSWAPYEKIFTNDLPKAWSISYQAFQSDFAGPMTAWFTESLPHFFTATIPDIWSGAYENFQRDFAGPITAWFTTSLPAFFTQTIPDIWSGIYQNFQRDIAGPITSWFTVSLPAFFTQAIPDFWSAIYTNFERDVGSPIAAWFTQSLPNFFTQTLPDLWSNIYTNFERDVGSPLASWFTTTLPGYFTGAVAWLAAVGTNIGNGLLQGWDALAGTISADFGKAKTWVEAAFSTAVSWLSAYPATMVSGFLAAWDSHGGSITADFAKVKTWVTTAFNGANTWLAAAGKDMVDGLVSAIEASPSIVENALLSLIPASVRTVVQAAIPGFATGTPFAPPGWAWVGEKGPELMRLAGGEQIKNHSASLSMMANTQSLGALSTLGVPQISGAARLPGVSSPAATGALQLTVSYEGSGNALTDSLVSGLRYHIAGQYGGDVQAGLGQGPVRT